MRITPLILLLLSLSLPQFAPAPARADLRITSDHGGYVTEYKEKYQRIRDRAQRNTVIPRVVEHFGRLDILVNCPASSIASRRWSSTWTAGT